MGKVDPREGYTQQPKLTPEDLGGDDATVMTIQKYEQFKKKDGEGMVRKLTFEEAPDKIHFLNVTQTEYLVEALGDEWEDWIGKVVPLVLHQGKDLKGKPITNLWVASPESWNEIFRAAGVPEMPSLRPRVSPVTKQVTTVKGRQAERSRKRVGKTVKRK